MFDADAKSWTDTIGRPLAAQWSVTHAYEITCVNLTWPFRQAARPSNLNHLSNSISMWRAATAVGPNVPRYSIIGAPISMVKIAICQGPVSIATNMDVPGWRCDDLPRSPCTSLGQ